MKMTKPEITPEELARLKVIFALRRMAPEVQSDVLSDGIVAARAGIDLSHPINLPEDIVIDRRVLFSAFQKAADGQPVLEMVDTSGAKREMQVEIEEESAFLTYGTHRIRFPQGALLSAAVEKRRTAAAIVLKKNTLTMQTREEFEAIISKPEFSHSDFLATTKILLGSPESFADTLREVAESGTLSKTDFIPSEIAHWENITAKRLASKTLPEFIKQELAAERAARVALDAGVAIDVLSLTFGGPELVPLEIMRQIDPETMMVSIRVLWTMQTLLLSRAHSIFARIALRLMSVSLFGRRDPR